MNHEQVVALVTEFVADLDPEVAVPLPGSTALSDLGVDSLSLMDLLALLEGSLGLAIPDADLPGLRTMDDLVGYATSAARSN